MGDSSSIPGLGRSPGEGIGYPLQYSWASLVVQMVKNLPALRETSVLSLGWEDPLVEGMATHFNILSWRIPGTEEPGGLQSMGSHRVGHDWLTWHTYFRKTKLFPGGSGVKNLPAVPETQEILVQFLHWEHPLEKKMATHSNILFFPKHSNLI